MAMRLGETPVPIPNTMVKTQAADGTMPGTAWESRWLPDSKKKIKPYDFINWLYFGGLAQLGEHLPCKQGVESSNLLVSMAGRVPAGRTLKTEYRNKPKSSI